MLIDDDDNNIVNDDDDDDNVDDFCVNKYLSMFKLFVPDFLQVFTQSRNSFEHVIYLIHTIKERIIRHLKYVKYAPLLF